MRILICAHDQPDYINGPNMWLQRLLPELRLRGVEARLLFIPFGDPERCPTIRALKDAGFECDVYSGRSYTEFRVRWILKRARVHRPDLFLPNLDIAAYHAASGIRRGGIPVVGVLHSDDPFYRAIVDEFIVRADPSPLSSVVVVSRFLEKLCTKLADGAVRVRRIPYGIPIPEARASFNGRTLQLIYAGRIVEPQKRISDVTRGLCQVVRAVPDTEAVLYGSGNSEERVRKIIEQAGLATRVRLGGLLENEELRKRLLDGQVFVLLSDYEGLPIALLEAMACGLVPVCTAMRSGIPELVTNGENGLTVDDRGTSLVAAVARLREEPGLWDRLSRSARARVESEFSIPSTADRWIGHFEELISTRSSPVDGRRIPRTVPLPERHEDINRNEDPRWPGYVRYYRNKLGWILSGRPG